MKFLSLDRSNFRAKWQIPVYLVLIIIGRLILQVALYRSGFLSLTADEFGRTVSAARWSQNPTIVWAGSWLPFHTYLLGLAFWIKWDLLYVPRVIVIFLGALSIPLMYGLAVQLTGSRRVGMMSALLLAVNPAHTWLSSTPLSAVPYSFLTLVAITSSTLYFRNNRKLFLYLAGLALAVANGFRFESWVLSAIFSLFIVGNGVCLIAKKVSGLSQSVNLIIVALLPWIFPSIWIVVAYLENGIPLVLLDSIRSYKSAWYGQSSSYLNYLKTFLRIDPYATIFGVLGLMFYLMRHRKSWAARWYSVIAIAPLIVFILLHGGQVEPQGNYFRYLTSFVIITYPALGYLIDNSVNFFAQSKRTEAFVIGLILGILIITQVRTTFRFTNDPSADGLLVGQRIKTLRLEYPELSQRPVLIELVYWQYLSIHIGANDISHIIYDRELDIERRQSTSLLLTNIDAFRDCMASHEFSYIILKSPDLRAVVERNLKLSPSEEINDYAFYQGSEGFLNENNAPGGICPLTSPSDY